MTVANAQRNCGTVPTGRILYSPGRDRAVLRAGATAGGPKKIVLAPCEPAIDTVVPLCPDDPDPPATRARQASTRLALFAGAGVAAAMAVSGASIPGERVSVSRSMNDGREFAAAADALSANTASQPLEQAPQPPILSVGYHPAVPEIREPAPAVLPHPVKNESAVIDAVHQIVRRYAPKRVDARTLAREIVKEAREQNYDPLFVAAVIKSESAFNALARSHVGARGLMQIMPATGRWLQQTKVDRRDQRGDLTDPGYNLRLGITYLKHLEEMYSGDRVFTLVAYNWGPGRVDRASGGRNKVPREVVQYALKILNDHRRWTAELTT